HTMKLDITKESDRKKAAEHTPDILINNAAIGHSGPLVEIPLEYVRDSFETNIFATLALTQALTQPMVKRRSGRIINISSVAGKMTLPYLGPYSMTKFATEGMSDALRRELAHHNVFVSIIEPGAFGTGFNEQMNKTKYMWFNKKSIFAKDALRIKAAEQVIENAPKNVDSIVKTIIHAVEARRPKIRYIAPFPSALRVFLSRILPDSIVDWGIEQRIKKHSKQ
ncbi:MAG: SDR family NAD(P)-dependent oxidoreductase, partial [Patescibacteria group bacterium]